ncbi:HD family phosphohydrolase [Bacteroidetes bacterium endosymbiont of Geopemphigus sp.]|uniref:HD family phosphohydrolase n=1 Tax=Bacteroidetes bacterium endosymbiont of Geopemphigus sp. TaxID=2047937 RepID=UPI001F4DBAD4|nr:HDIG domain-containing metalloprotein [Bacteroidetes bacterium endosymbiont of Geopemphigus sp.]
MFSIFWLIYLFPIKHNFRYKFSKGEFWNYEDLYAPFDFGLIKTEKQINEEKQEIKENEKYYFEKDKDISPKIRKEFNERMALFNDPFLKKKGLEIIDSIYSKGYISTRIFPYYLKANDIITIKSGANSVDMPYGVTFNLEKVQAFIDKSIPESNSRGFFFKETLKDIIRPNIFFNEDLTQKTLDIRIASMSKTKAVITKGTRIITKGDLVNDDNFQKLSSIKSAYDEQIWTRKNNYHLTSGYLLLLSTVLCMFFSYLYFLTREVYHNINSIGFLVISILCKSTLSIIILRQESDLVYLVPFCLLPIVIRAFFDFNISFVTHLTTIMLLAPVMPHSFDFSFLQITAGTLGLLTRTNIYKRVNLFITSIKIVLIYILSFCGLMLIQDGTLDMITPKKIFIFFISGTLVLFAQPLIYLFERLFGLTSNLSLLELSDSNSILLRLLSQKAPGTLQHSLTVANLAEEAARQVEADPLLVRIGALYHDIGKIENPAFFTENQRNIIDPHEELPPEESAEIILEHVPLGIELAKKHKLPDKIIDFIRTHHGDTLVYYFYKKYKEKHPNKDIDSHRFCYNGPKPFSKETAILMVCDSIEAASKSLQNPSGNELENLVEEIVNKQMKENQFSNADITLKEIERIKGIIKKKLVSIYHTRIEYPE